MRPHARRGFGRAESAYRRVFAVIGEIADAGTDPANRVRVFDPTLGRVVPIFRQGRGAAIMFLACLPWGTAPFAFPFVLVGRIPV